MTHHVLIVGTGPRAVRFLGDLRLKHPKWKIFGFIDKDPALIGSVIGGYPVLGSFENLEKILSTENIHEVFFVVPRQWLLEIETLIQCCETFGVPASLASDLFNLKTPAGKIHSHRSNRLVTYQPRLLTPFEKKIKRLFDIPFSLAMLILFSLPCLLIVVIIKCTSKGPALFKQTRIGLNGKPFIIYKFRTMIMNAEALRDTVLPMNQMVWPILKIKNDPRITKVGKLLRTTSFDEFPQFWNILKGDMSVVGPRPLPLVEAMHLQPSHRRRLSVKPGLTGLWQVSGRNNVDVKKWMELDLHYIDTWSVTLDIKIVLKTIVTVLTGNGAC